MLPRHARSLSNKDDPQRPISDKLGSQSDKRYAAEEERRKLLGHPSSGSNEMPGIDFAPRDLGTSWKVTLLAKRPLEVTLPWSHFDLACEQFAG